MNEKTQEQARYRGLRRASRMLSELASLADHASLTGSMRDGAADATAAFNQILSYVNNQGIDLNGLVSPLTGEASFDRVGVATRLLRAVVDDEMAADEDRDVRVVIRKAKHLKELGRIKDVGAILREHLPEFLRDEPEEE